MDKTCTRSLRSQDHAIFLNSDGSPIRFYIAPCKEKAEIRKIVSKHGGTLSSTFTGADFKLTTKLDVLDDTYVHVDFIRHSVEKQRKLDIENYRVKKMKQDGKSSISPQLSARSRKPYSGEEDQMILDFLQTYARADGKWSIGGNAIWKKMEEEKVTLHTWQSMRDHYHKQLKPVYQTRKPVNQRLYRGKIMLVADQGPSTLSRATAATKRKEEGTATITHKDEPAIKSPKRRREDSEEDYFSADDETEMNSEDREETYYSANSGTLSPNTPSPTGTAPRLITSAQPEDKVSPGSPSPRSITSARMLRSGGSYPAKYDTSKTSRKARENVSPREGAEDYAADLGIAGKCKDVVSQDTVEDTDHVHAAAEDNWGRGRKGGIRLNTLKEKWRQQRQATKGKGTETATSVALTTHSGDSRNMDNAEFQIAHRKGATIQQPAQVTVSMRDNDTEESRQETANTEDGREIRHDEGVSHRETPKLLSRAAKKQMVDNSKTERHQNVLVDNLEEDGRSQTEANESSCPDTEASSVEHHQLCSYPHCLMCNPDSFIENIMKKACIKISCGQTPPIKKTGRQLVSTATADDAQDALSLENAKGSPEITTDDNKGYSPAPSSTKRAMEGSIQETATSMSCRDQENRAPGRRVEGNESPKAGPSKDYVQWSSTDDEDDRLYKDIKKFLLSLGGAKQLETQTTNSDSHIDQDCSDRREISFDRAREGNSTNAGEGSRKTLGHPSPHTATARGEKVTNGNHAMAYRRIVFLNSMPPPIELTDEWLVSNVDAAIQTEAPFYRDGSDDEDDDDRADETRAPEQSTVRRCTDSRVPAHEGDVSTVDKFRAIVLERTRASPMLFTEDKVIEPQNLNRHCHSMALREDLTALMLKHKVPAETILRILHFSNGKSDHVETAIKTGRTQWSLEEDQILHSENREDIERLILKKGVDEVGERIEYLESL